MTEAYRCSDRALPAVPGSPARPLPQGPRCGCRTPIGCSIGSTVTGPVAHPWRRSARLLRGLERSRGGSIADSLEEDCFHLLVNPAHRALSLAGARVLAGQLREAVEHRHAVAMARVGHSRACPLDLHALVPVPGAILLLGLDHPDALTWLWQHWGTTQATAPRGAGHGPHQDARPGAGGGRCQAAAELLVGGLDAVASL